jgi:predicted MFS family arabinose efflux permease
MDRQAALGWVAVAATTLVLTFSAFSVLTITAIGPEMAADLGVAPSLIGYQISLVYAAAGISGLYGGTTVRKWGACRTSQGSMLGTVVGVLLLVTGWPPAFLLGSLVLGLSNGVIHPAASHLLIRMADSTRRNMVFSIKQTGVPLGGIAAGFIGPPLALAYGWEAAVLTGAIASFLLLVTLQFFRKEFDSDRISDSPFDKNPFTGIGLVWRDLTIRWMSLAGFCLSLVQLCLMTFLVTMLVTDVGFELIQAGLLLAAVHAVGALSRVFFGWLADRLGGAMGILMAVGIGSIIICVLITQLTSDWPVLATQLLFVVFGISGIGWNGIFYAELATKCSPEEVGSITGGSLAFVFGGVSIGPALFAASYFWIGSYTATFGLVSLAAASAVLFMFLARRSDRLRMTDANG